MICGYARVSTREQDLAAQIEALTAGAEKVFKETASGVKTQRRELARAIGALEADDVLMVTRLDRLARSTRDLLNVLAAVSEKGARFRSLGDAWADSTSMHGRLMLTVLAGIAEFERDLIRSRIGEGKKRAKAVGVHFGPHFRLTPHQQREVIARRENGELVADIAASYGVSRRTILRTTQVTPVFAASRAGHRGYRGQV
jgi:DNA invertase Pin-like site-specific DNA recombinase